MLPSIGPPPSSVLPPALVPRPPIHERRANMRARQRETAAATARGPASYNHPLDTPAQRRYHTARATTRNFGRVPTYLPRVKNDVLAFASASRLPQASQSHARQASARSHLPGKSGAAQGPGAPATEERRKNKQEQGQARIEKERNKLQEKRDKIAIKEAFAVIDDDGGVSSPAILPFCFVMRTFVHSGA